MGPRGVAAIYFTHKLMPDAPESRSRPSPARITILARRGRAQGYHLNCKKIKEFLISSIATALLLVLTFIFISVTSYAPILFRLSFFLFFLHTPFSWSNDLTVYAFCIVKIGFGYTSCFRVRCQCYQWNVFTSRSKWIQKLPFSSQSFREYIWFIIRNGLVDLLYYHSL